MKNHFCPYLSYIFYPVKNSSDYLYKKSFNICFILDELANRTL